jgi:hypothetical protein
MEKIPARREKKDLEQLQNEGVRGTYPRQIRTFPNAHHILSDPLSGQLNKQIRRGYNKIHRDDIPNIEITIVTPGWHELKT